MMMKKRKTNLPTVVFVLLICGTRTSGEQETTLPTDTTSTAGNSALALMQAYDLNGTKPVSPVKPSSHENETSEQQPTEDKVSEASEKEQPIETAENSAEDTITLPITVVTVVLILLLSTSVLHCVVVIHYCIKIWSCCTEQAEDDADFSPISELGLGDASNRSSLNKRSVVLRKENKRKNQQRGTTILEDRSTYQDYSYRCNSDYADGFLNLDRAINHGRHSRRISCFENQLSGRLNQSRPISACSDNGTAAAGETSAILPTIKVEYQDEKAASDSATRAGSASSVPESLERSSEGASAKAYAKCQEDPENLTFADVHATNFVTEDNYSLSSIQWHVVDTVSEPPTGKIVPLGYKLASEETGTSLGLRECNTVQQQMKGSVEELAKVEIRKKAVALEHLGLRESNTAIQQKKDSVEELAKLETRKPVMALERDSTTAETNAPKRATSAVYLKQPTDIQIHKQKQQQPQATEIRRFSSFEPQSREIYQSPRQDSVSRGAKRHYFLHFGGPETCV